MKQNTRLAMTAFEFRTMRGRLLTWMTLLVMFPVILLVVIGLGYSEEQLRQRVVSELSYSAEALMKSLDSRIDVQVEDNRVFSRSPYLQQAIRDFSAVFEPGFIYSMEYQELEDRYWAYLSYYAEKHAMTDLLLVNRQGDVVFSAAQSSTYGKNLLHVDFAGHSLRDAFEQAIWQMDSVIDIGRDDSAQFASLAAPVVDDELLGVVIQLPSSGILNRLLEVDGADSSLAQSLYIALADGTFRRLGDSQSTEQGSPLNKMLMKAYLGNNVDTELTEAGTTWLISAKPLPALNGVVVVSQDKSKALAAVRDLRISATIGAAILLVIVVLVGIRVSSSLTRPLKALTTNLEKIGRGQRQLRMDEDRKDELGTLAREFNHMAESLRNTQAQLVQSEKMASIGQLAAGVAHEINNPMSIVTANIDTMKQYTDIYVVLIDLYDRYIKAMTEGQTDEGSKIAEQIVSYQKQEDIQFVYDDMKSLVDESMSGLGRVKHIVGSLKVFSELDNAQEESVNLTDTLQHVVADIDATLRRDIQFEFDIRIKEPVRFKTEQMRRVFDAVLDNACRACADDGKIRIRAWADKNSHIVEIKDNGSGIEESVMSHIFNPFFTTRPVGEGLGLGLAVAHSIVEAHGGKMRVVSKAGLGTQVRLYIPRMPLEKVA